MTKLILLVVCVLVVYVNARHIHPHEDAEEERVWRRSEAEREKSAPLKEENLEVELIRNMKPSRFVPINNAIFFMGYLPCQDGFKRDYMGVCREVWD